MSAFFAQLGFFGKQCPWKPVDRERRLWALFDTAVCLDVDAVLLRRGVLSENAIYETVQTLTAKAAALLAWACDTGICQFDEDAGQWRILVLEVVFVPQRNPEFLDLRTIEAGPRKSALQTREARTRMRIRQREQAFVLRMVLVHADRMLPEQELPASLLGQDLPTVKTWAEFKAHINSCLPHMPLWRSYQVLQNVLQSRGEDTVDLDLLEQFYAPEAIPPKV